MAEYRETTTVRPTERTAADRTTLPARSGRSRWIWIAVAVVLALIILIFAFGGNDVEEVGVGDAVIIEPVAPTVDPAAPAPVE